MSDHFAGKEDSSLGWVVIRNWASLSDLRYVRDARVESHHYCKDEGLPPRITVIVSGGHQYTLLADIVKERLGLGDVVTGVFLTYKGDKSNSLFHEEGYMTDFFPRPLPGK